jgi:hypothetical protein
MLSGKFEKYANLWYNKYAFYIWGERFEWDADNIVLTAF